MRDYNEIKKALESRKDRSKWDKGVTLYALELLEEIEENLSFEGKFYSDFTNKADFEEYGRKYGLLREFRENAIC